MPSSGSLLWQLTPPDAPAPSFLFGTMHVRDQRAFAGLGQVYEAIEACDGFALEIDLNQGGHTPDPELFRLPGQNRLTDYISPRQFKRLRTILHKAFGIDIAFFTHFRPLLLIELLTERILQEEQPLFLDAHLWDYATERGKVTSGIESREEQETLLQRIPLEVQVRMLLDIGRRVRHFRRQLNHMTALYEAGDLKRLYQVSRHSAGELRKSMLFDRNHIMASRIAPLIAGQPTFIAVGAAHLWGGKGILRLLKLQDIRIKPVPLQA
jgi:uncharacterized protein YbaP (TraB family)